MPPAHQRLDADDAAVGDVDLRLKNETEALLFDRSAEILGERDALTDLRIERVGEEPVSAPSIGFCAVECEVRVGEQNLWRHGIPVVQRDADAGAAPNDVACDRIRFAERLQQLGGKDGRFGRLADPGREHGEFIAAEPRDGVGFADIRAQAFADRDEELISDRVPERVVDVLEMVEIQVKHGETGFRPPSRASHRLVQRFDEDAAVG